MNRRELRAEIASIEHQLADLRPWEAQLTVARQQRLVQSTREAREELVLIDRGIRHGQGRPNDPVFAPFDEGRPGLIEARQTIAELQERWTALQDALPDSPDYTHEAEEIRTLAATLEEQTAAAVATLNEAARLALIVAQQTRTLWEKNAALDKLTRDADVPRPDTPRRDALTYPLAAPLGQLLVGYFMGGSPHAVDTHIIERITHGG